MPVQPPQSEGNERDRRNQANQKSNVDRTVTGGAGQILDLLGLEDRSGRGKGSLLAGFVQEEGVVAAHGASEAGKKAE
jgi:hypothetical protein